MFFPLFYSWYHLLYTTSNSIYLTLISFVENKSSLFAAVVLTAKSFEKGAGFVPLVTFFSSRTLLLHIQNYADYFNNYYPNQLYLRCFRVKKYIRNIQQIEEVRDKTKEETIKYEEVKDKVQNEKKNLWKRAL